MFHIAQIQIGSYFEDTDPNGRFSFGLAGMFSLIEGNSDQARFCNSPSPAKATHGE